MTLRPPTARKRPWLAAAWLAALLLAGLSASGVAGLAGSDDSGGSETQAADLNLRTTEPGTAELGSTVLDNTPLATEATEPQRRPSGSVTSLQGGVGTTARRSTGGLTGVGSDLAALITELPSASIGAPEAETREVRPIGLTIESLGVETAAVIAVGIETNGDMEIPPAEEVGWYQYGPSPGETGSSVLAAHIAYDGKDGVFVNLDDLEIGSVIEVAYDDGTSQRFTATAKEQYDKNELPRESVFARTGEPQLVLITCGGDFNRAVRSYEDNVVVYATPLT